MAKHHKAPRKTDDARLSDGEIAFLMLKLGVAYRQLAPVAMRSSRGLDPGAIEGGAQQQLERLGVGLDALLGLELAQLGGSGAARSMTSVDRRQLS